MATADVSLSSLVNSNTVQTKNLFASQSPNIPSQNFSNDSDPLKLAQDVALRRRMNTEYDSNARTLPSALAARQQAVTSTAIQSKKRKRQELALAPTSPTVQSQSLEQASQQPSKSRAPLREGQSSSQPFMSDALITRSSLPTRAPEPAWHAPWTLSRVISGHLGWVRALTVEPDNQWFASGAGDRTIKIWDLASGSLRLTLTGHISTVRGLAVSPRHPYLFSCGEDKMVKCWDLETNKVIRHYHGHLSGVYTLALHPTLDVLVTGGRDGVGRVWDMRTRSNIHVLSGHTQTVSDLKCQEADPQVITSSLDATVRLWDLAAGKTMGVLTHHKKGVRSLTIHPNEFTFASSSTGSIKQWKCPEGQLMENFDGHNAVINTLAVNEDDVLFSGGDNGSMASWDWKTGHMYQKLDTTAQPGSLDAESGIFSSTYDRTGLRLITGEADKTIKIWKQDDDATPETHPLNWQPTLRRKKY